jgi:hypothetical protein
VQLVARSEEVQAALDLSEEPDRHG